jgi:aspartyl-tRNA(Asn)/glutamyl-tRNA(Gln) amidotransferase subunit A
MVIETVPLARLATDLASGRVTSQALTEACLARIEEAAGEGKRSFTAIYRPTALAAAAASDRLRAAGLRCGPLAGIPMSVKDLFDVAGETTQAGSLVLEDQPPAVADAPIVARLRAAGAVIIGKTNMVEFAYSGLGLNPHFGTPANPYDHDRVPGGSSSGAGVAVPYGFCAASIGTDTGGSVRIPAAFNKLAGLKPTQRRVPRLGAVPLSTSLDSVGPLAPSAACCALIDAVLAGEEPGPLALLPLRGLRFAVPGRDLTDGLDHTVGRAFDRALSLLSEAGAIIVDTDFRELALINDIARHGGIAPPEAYAWHRRLIQSKRALYDPRVLSRLLLAEGISAADYIDVLHIRAAAIAAFDRATAPFDAVLCPSVAIVPPRFDELTRDEDYHRLNYAVLRNTYVFNILDRCALSIPCSAPNELPVGLMLVGPTGGDRRLLEIGAAAETVLGA